MDFRVLGSLEVADSSRIIDLGTPKQRALLALLLIEANRVVSLDRLIDQLWAGVPPAQATGTLRAYIANLRRALEPDRPPRQLASTLVTRPPGYALQIASEQLDAFRFEVLATRGQKLLIDGRPEEARQALEEALSLWRGPAYAEFATEDFAQAEAARLQELQAVAIEDLVEVNLALGRHAGAVAELEARLSESPLRERLWALLMLALYRSGRQGDALRAYQRARHVLAEELGIEPSPNLRRLEADILAQATDLEWQPIATARAHPASARPSRGPDRQELAGTRRILVGREAELAYLEEVLARATAGRGVLVLVSGDAGIGKTALVDELAVRAQDRGLAVAWGRCFEGEGAAPFWPWIQVLRVLAADRKPAELGVALTDLGPELSQLMPEWAEEGAIAVRAPLGDTSSARLRLYETVSTALRRLVPNRPLVLLVEDIHWGDVPSLELLTYLADQIEQFPILAVATYREVEARENEAAADTLAALARRPAVERIALTGLEPVEVARFLAIVTGAEPSPRLVRAVYARTEGNPFFVTQLVQLLSSEGVLTGPGAEAAALHSGVPAGVRDVLRRRLARLPEPTNALLTVAAVAGHHFHQAVLEAVGGLDQDATLEFVELALVSGLVNEVTDKVGSYRFSHALVRETIYDALSAVRRARLHARVGTALEQLYGGEDSEHASDLAHHFWQAAAVVGAEKGLPFVLRAAEGALGRLAYEEAEQQLRRAVVLLQSLPDTEERARQELGVQVRLGVLLAVTRGQAAPGVDTAFARAGDLCRAVGGAPELVPALWGQLAFSYAGGREEIARGLGEQLVSMGERSGDPMVLLAGHAGSGLAFFHLGELAAARDHFERAIAISDSMDAPLLGELFQVHPGVPSRGYFAMVLVLSGVPDQAEALIDSTQRVVSKGHPFDVSVARVLRAMVSVLERDARATQQNAEAALAFATERGFALMEDEATVMLGWAVAEQGQAETGVTRLRQGLAAFEAAGTKVLRPFFYALLAEAELRAGRHDRALAAVDEGLAAAADGERFFEPELHRLRGELLLAGPPGHRLEAEASLRLALSAARAQGAVLLEERAAQSLRTAGIALSSVATSD